MSIPPPPHCDIRRVYFRRRVFYRRNARRSGE